ncbi:hypothetical protein IW262DRAFT_217115 [Armillaria fumosa]|nr:hypothetical protein IW262DRAFT_217115 [Armillaria fumosa]
MPSTQMDSYHRPSRVVCCLITSLALVSIFPTLWISIVLGTVPPNTTSEVSIVPSWYQYEDQEFPNRTIMLDANVVSADILHTTMIVDWAFAYDTCNHKKSPYNCTAVNIFFDIDLSPSDPRYNNGPYSNNITRDPLIIWNGNLDYRFPTIRTELVISTTDVSSLSAYPFDIYFVDIVAYAQDVLTNTSVILKLTGLYGLISGIKTTTNTVQFPPQSVYSELLETPYPTSHFTEISVHLERSTLVIVYCIIITVTFWMIALIICLIMIATVFFRFRQRNEIVVVPIGTVFAFTQLRASMPGAPEGFGDTLDFVGLLPCLILLSISVWSMNSAKPNS